MDKQTRKLFWTGYKTMRWLISYLLFFLMACKQSEKENIFIPNYNLAHHFARIDSAKLFIKTGDLIFRTGSDDVSRAARSMNRIDTSFSHCGLIGIENDSIFVYHAIGGDYNPSQKLKRDLIDSFLTPTETNCFAIYRYLLDTAQINILQNWVQHYYAIGLKFDLLFDFKTDDKMYCSEFVFKCLNKAMADSLRKIIHARPWPFGITPDDLYLNKKSNLVKWVDYFN